VRRSDNQLAPCEECETTTDRAHASLVHADVAANVRRRKLRTRVRNTSKIDGLNRHGLVSRLQSGHPDGLLGYV
jgi:hypothetical protein